MRILVTFALQQEFAPWRRRGGFEPDGWTEGKQTYRTRQGGIEVLALLTSVGSENAARAVDQVMRKQAFDLVISSGLAGGLKSEHRPGSLLAGRKVRRLGDGRELALPDSWLSRAKELGAQEAVFVTSERMAVTGKEKRGLGIGADAVEMESFAVIEQATERKVPAVIIRAVSDPVETDLPLDFNRVFDAKGRLRAASFAGQILSRPASVPGLVRLARQSRRASAALAEFLDRYVAAAARDWTGEQTGVSAGQ